MTALIENRADVTVTALQRGGGEKKKLPGVWKQLTDGFFFRVVLFCLSVRFMQIAGKGFQQTPPAFFCKLFLGANEKKK